MCTRRLAAAVALAGGLGATGTAQASLYDRGGGLIYDSTLDITWLWDANYAKTSGYHTVGWMNWYAAVAWVDGLSYYDSVRAVTHSDWRLPTALNQDGTGPCGGFGCSGSEMGYMFYTNLGAQATDPISSGSNKDNLALFVNLMSYVYWSSTEDASDPNTSDPGYAWGFSTSAGNQEVYNKHQNFYVWPVRDGDVAAAVVPLPGPLWLIGAGLLSYLGLGFTRRRT